MKSCCLSSLATLLALLCNLVPVTALDVRQSQAYMLANVSTLRLPSNASNDTSALQHAIVLRACKHNANRTHVCPVKFKDETVQKAYFEKLHKAIIDGNGKLEGCRDGSSQEFYVTEFKSELECLYATMLDDSCNGMPSQHDTRQKTWEGACLNPDEDLLAAYDLMSEAEKKYFHRFKKSASERQIYTTYLDLAGYKELVCILMKTIDDECRSAYSSPRLLAPSM